LTVCTKTRLLAKSAETPTVVRWSHPGRNPSLPREAWRTKLTNIIFAFQDFWEHESPCGRDACRMVNRINRWSSRANSIVSVLAVSVVLITGCSSSATGGKSVPPIVGTITSNSATINFSPTQVGATATQKVTLSASGSSVTVTSAQVSGAGFAVVSPTLPSTLSSGQSLALTIQFAPQTAGQLNASLVIASNASNSTLTVALLGSGTAASAGTIAANSTTVNFGPTEVSATATQNVTLSVSGAPITVTSAQVSGAGFAVVSPTLPSTLSSGQSLVLTIQFAPQTVGQLSGSLMIASNASNSTLTVALLGSGTAAPVGTIAANSTTVNFGPTQVGSTATQNVTLSVSGAPITVTSAQVSGAGFTVASPMLPSTLSPGQSLVLAVQFAPQTVGQLSGSLMIASNASNSTLTVALLGSGTAAPAHSATVSWASGDPAAVAYLVFRSDVSGGPYVPLTTSLLTELSYTDSTVSSGSTYFYVITELDAAGDESPFSSEVSATVP
jgi:Abnormal spindle-like microcephaly-assoc'd, ASPM-SPD-2-Hydin